MPRSQTGQNHKLHGSRQGETHSRNRVCISPRPVSSSPLISDRHAVRVSPQFSNRMIEASRSILNRYIPDIYLYSDVYKGDESGK